MNNIYILSLENLNLVAKYILRKKNIFVAIFLGMKKEAPAGVT